MNHLKMLGLAVLAAMALVAIAGVGTASAGGGVLCENKNEPCTTTWEVNSHMTFVLKSGTNSRIVSTIGSALRTCTASELTAKVTRAGSATERGKGEVKNEWLTWGGCGAGFGQKTVTPGEIEFEWRSTEAGTKGTVFANNLVITADIGGFDCFYKFGTGLDIGVFTPSANGLDGILAVNAVLTLENNSPHSSSFMCPSSVKWEAEYTQETGSTPLWIK